METVTLDSPAKINLFLEVLGLRDDGYHEIRSVLQLIDLCDRVTLRRQRQIEVEVIGAASFGQKNLAYRAAHLLLKKVGMEEGVRVAIEKRIPVGGGLGGGSSNAAATLWGLKLLYGLDLSSRELMALGGQLGSDVPFFFSKGIAFASGRGEVIRPLPSLPSRWVVVANPGIPISTTWAYRALTLELTNEEKSHRILLLLEQGEGEKALSLSFNRLEEVVLREYPEVARLKHLLAARGARPVLMTGSGSSVFGMVEDRTLGAGIVAGLKRDGYFAVLCRTLDYNPLYGGGLH